MYCGIKCRIDIRLKYKFFKNHIYGSPISVGPLPLGYFHAHFPVPFKKNMMGKLSAIFLNGVL